MGKKYDVWATRPTRYNGERVEPGEKVESVDESEMSGLMSSGRFTDDPKKAPKKETKKEEVK